MTNHQSQPSTNQAVAVTLEWIPVVVPVWAWWVVQFASDYYGIAVCLMMCRSDVAV
ncbi:MAG: hypothetical protein JEZ06_10800 [Anaerolineaceae bacterium]|nr:hypothetical protein [Anaerolineaceae bacterium]